MEKFLRRYFVIFIAFLTTSCGLSKIEKKFSNATNSSENNNSDGGTRSSTGGVAPTDGITLKLWERSPAYDSGNFSIDFNDNVQSISRKDVPLYDLLSTTNSVASSYITVQPSTSNSSTPSFASYQNKNISWNTKDFQTLMLYAHLSKAVKETREIFTSSEHNTFINKHYPIKAYSSELGHPFEAGLTVSFVGSTGELRDKYISFYQNPNSSAYGKFNAVDEADAIYHEFAHVLQLAFAQDVHLFGTNSDLEMIREGLADFYAATITQDKNILKYLEASSDKIFSSRSRSGNVHSRNLNHNMSFPNAHIHHEHLDGRVLAAALFDFATALTGQTVNLANCPSCSEKINGLKNLSLKDALYKATAIAYRAYSELTSNSSLNAYGEKLANHVLDTNNEYGYLSSICNNNSSCKSEMANVFKEILKGRGIIAPENDVKYNSPPNDTFDSSDTAQVASTLNSVINSSENLSRDLGWIPYTAITGVADNDNLIEPCEVVVVFPNIKNNTPSRLNTGLYNIRYEVHESNTQASSGFREIYSGNSSVNTPYDNVFIDSDCTPNSDPKLETDPRCLRPTRHLGWINPGENSQTLMQPGSRWYQKYNNASMMKEATFNTVTSHGGGFLVRAPSNVGDTAELSFRIWAQANKTDHQDFYRYIIKQNIEVSEPNAGGSFCSGG